MNKDKITLLLASVVTLMFGPGMGHLIIKEWKRAILFISVSCILLLVLSAVFVSNVNRETLEAITNFKNIEQFKNLYSEFQQTNPKSVLMFNILFAALWAYSIVDLFKITKNKNILKKEEL